MVQHNFSPEKEAEVLKVIVNREEMVITQHLAKHIIIDVVVAMGDRFDLASVKQGILAGIVLCHRHKELGDRLYTGVHEAAEYAMKELGSTREELAAGDGFLGNIVDDFVVCLGGAEDHRKHMESRNGH